jgi:hypothetical protein
MSLVHYLDDLVLYIEVDATMVGSGSTRYWADVDSDRDICHRWSDHYTVEAEDSEGSDDESLMPPLGRGPDSDGTDTTVSTAGDEAQERYNQWVEANPQWVVRRSCRNRRYSPTVDWLSDEDSIADEEGSVPTPESLMQALDDDSSWEVHDLEEDVPLEIWLSDNDFDEEELPLEIVD